MCARALEMELLKFDFFTGRVFAQ